MRISKLFLRLVVLFLILTTSLTVGGWQRGEFMFIDEIQLGMQGICKTVVKGTEISTFNFEVIDVIKAPKPIYDLIMVEVWGDAINESGGVAHGMSGSPCYIDNKLVGALAYAYHWEPVHIQEKPHAFLEPVENMLQIIDECKQEAQALIAENLEPANLSGSPSGEVDVKSKIKQINKVKFVSSRPSLEELKDAPGTAFAERLATPIMVGGLSNRTFNWLKNGVDKQIIEDNRRDLLNIYGEEQIDHFANYLSRGLEERYGLRLYQMNVNSQAGSLSNPNQLEAGGALGVALLLDDILLYSYGTVTYVEDDCFVAFGHPFVEAGETDMPVTSAYVSDTIGTVEMNFKEASLGTEVGTLIRDRHPGIGGIIGAKSKTIQFNIKVTDTDTGKSEQFRVRSVSQPDLYPGNAFFAGYDAVYQTINRTGQGTAKMRLSISGTGMVGTLEREDIFISQWDVAQYAPLQISEIAWLLAYNGFADPQINKIDVDIEVEKAIRALPIVAMETDRDSYSSGATVRYTVRMNPYRQRQTTVQGTLTIPRGVDGTVWIEAFPARDAFWKFDRRSGYYWDVSLQRILSLGDLIEAIEAAPGNDEMLVWAYSDIYGVLDWELRPFGMTGYVTGYQYKGVSVR